MDETDTENGQEKTSRTMEGCYAESQLLIFVHLLLERGMTKSQMRIEAGLTTNV